MLLYFLAYFQQSSATQVNSRNHVTFHVPSKKFLREKSGKKNPIHNLKSKEETKPTTNK